MGQRGGFVPNEVRYPARSLNPVWVRSLERRGPRTASPVAEKLREEKKKNEEKSGSAPL
jgi:hypothetical protein